MPKKPDRSVKIRRVTGKPIPSDGETALEFASGKAGRSGKVPGGDVRLTANINKELHTRLRIESAKRRKPVGEIIEEWIKEHITE